MLLLPYRETRKYFKGGVHVSFDVTNIMKRTYSMVQLMFVIIMRNRYKFVVSCILISILYFILINDFVWLEGRGFGSSYVTGPRITISKFCTIALVKHVLAHLQSLKSILSAHK